MLTFVSESFHKHSVGVFPNCKTFLANTASHQFFLSHGYAHSNTRAYMVQVKTSLLITKCKDIASNPYHFRHCRTEVLCEEMAFHVCEFSSHHHR